MGIIVKDPLVFFGNERLATGVSTSAPTLRALIEAGYKICAVVSNYQLGKSRNQRSLEIEEVAKKYHIPLLLPNRPFDIQQELKDFNATAGVLVAYGKIVPQMIIDIFPRGIINIHPSLLPKHRGPTPIESVIINGEAETGVSIMALAKEMDAGPLYTQAKLGLDGSETKQRLADQLLELGKDQLIEVLPGILDGKLVAKPQQDSKATYDNLISKSDGLIDWQKSAEKLEKQIRAYAIWPASRSVLANVDVMITQVSVRQFSGKPGSISIENGQLVVYCGNDALVIEKLKPAGKNEMSGTEFLAGYRKRLSP